MAAAAGQSAGAGEGGKPRIVIIGSGFAGAHCAQKLERLLRQEEAEVLLIDRHNYFIFYPLLVEAGTGSLQPRHAVVPIRNFLSRENFLMAEVVSIDLETSKVTILVGGEPQPRELLYDHLVLALGSVTNMPPVPGLKEFGYEVKTLAHAVALRDRAIQLLELANATAPFDPGREKVRAMLRFVVVGANFTGVEVAGEFEDYLRKAAREYPNLQPEDVGITLVDRTPHILNVLDDPELSGWAAEHMGARHIDLLLNESVNEVREASVLLRSGQVVEAYTTIWAAGIAPSPLLKATKGLPADRFGYILCERDLRVQGLVNVWGIGDCAVNKDADGKQYPATAQHAIKEGKDLARNLASVLRGGLTRPCDIVSQGSLAAFGRFDAVAKVLGARLTGFPAWFMWRTVYLMKMPGFGRKVRVALDWTVDLLFKREYAELGLHRVMRAAPEHAPAGEKAAPTGTPAGSVPLPAQSAATSGSPA